MLTPTHLVVVVLVAMILRLDKNEWFVALLFGVAIDIDHVFGLPRYVSDNGWAALLRQSWDDGSGLPWRSWFHEPMAVIVVGHISTGSRLALPLAFWSLHIGMDQLQLALGTLNAPVESAILVTSTAGILFLAYSEWALTSDRSGLRAFADHLVASSKARMSALKGVI